MKSFNAVGDRDKTHSKISPVGPTTSTTKGDANKKLKDKGKMNITHQERVNESSGINLLNYKCIYVVKLNFFRF